MGIFKKWFTGPQGPIGYTGPQGMRGEPGPVLEAPYIYWHLGSGAIAPSFAHSQDAGRDLHSLERVSMPPGSTAMVRTGVSIVGGLPTGWGGFITSRSGLAGNHGIHVLNSPGLVDPVYTGELKVILHNSGKRRYEILKGDRIAQFVVMPVATGEGEINTRRARGFGSTGVSVEVNAPAASEETGEQSTEEKVDLINHPPHYAEHPIFTGEAIKYTSKMGFMEGNAFKYLWRCMSKGSTLADLSKAVWYLTTPTWAGTIYVQNYITDADVERLQDELAAAVGATRGIFGAATGWESVTDILSKTEYTEEEKGVIRLQVSLEASRALVKVARGDDVNEIIPIIKRASSLIQVLDDADKVPPGAIV